MAPARSPTDDRPVLLTGGCGDLGTVLSLSLGDRALLFDPRPPQAPAGRWIEGSILDRPALAQAVAGASRVVHIAAWHGVHHHRGWKTPAEFHDLNVTGTFNVLEACRRAETPTIFISSTSVDDPHGVYGHTKILGESMCRAWRDRGVPSLILRPRAFIPHWNRAVYDDYVAWVAWFWKGAVHISDVARAVELALAQDPAQWAEAPLPLDGAYEYTAADLAGWRGEATFERVYPGWAGRIRALGLDPARAPRPIGSEAAAAALGYRPRFGLGSLLAELDRWGRAGPPPPWPQAS